MSDVSRWLGELGLGQLSAKLEAAEVDLDSLALLTELDLREMDIPIGPRRKLLAAIAGMQKAADAGSDRNPPERRQLTIVFCDMVGSTEFAARLDPEDFSELTRKYLSRCSALARSSGGVVANYVGDAFQVLFGYPAAEEDDTERALQLAIEILSAVSQLEAPDGSKLRVRIGIASGLVVVGDMEGAPAGVSTVALGSVPNLAQRLQTLAEPGTILVDRNTFDATVRNFEFADLGENTLKGFTQPVHVYRLIKATSKAYRFSGDTRLTRFVGRDDELGHLVANWTSVAGTSRGRIVSLTGEPGIGKSRLVFELRQRLSGNRSMILQCAPAFANSALYPFLRLLKDHVGIADGDHPAGASERLARFLSSSEIPLAASLPIFSRLLALEPVSAAPSELAGAQQEAAILKVFVNFFRKLTRLGPLLLVVEDEQWIDPSSQRLLQAVADALGDLPILLLVTSRRGVLLTDRGEDRDRIKLARLSSAQAEELLHSLAEHAALAGDVMESLLGRAEGVPLFLEELARSVLDRELTGGLPAPAGLSVPASLQSALLSRLDKLGRVKSIAQTAAVIGREFDLNTLAHVVGISADALRPQIDQLIDVGLVVAQPYGNWPRYAFSHSLLQEAAQAALLRNRRRDLHEQVAQAIEAVEPRTAIEHPEVLAQHYDEAHLHDRAAGYWLSAGRRLAATWAKVEAAHMFRRGIECLGSMPDSLARSRKQLIMELERGDVLYAAFGYMTPDGSEAYRNAMRLSRIVEDPEAAVNALDGLFGTAFNSARFDDAQWASDQLREIGQSKNRIKALVLGLQFGGMCAFALGRFAEARQALEEALVYRKDAESIGSDFPSMAMIYLSWTLHMLGEDDASTDLFRSAEIDAREQNAYRLAAFLGNGCILMFLKQNHEELKRLVTELTPLATRNGFQLWLNLATFFGGWEKLASNSDPSGVEEMRHICDHMGEQEVDKTCYLGILADSYLRIGQLNEALSLVDEAIALGARTGEAYYLAELLRLRAELLVRTGKSAEGDRVFQEAMEAALKQDARSWAEKISKSVEARP